MRLGHFIGTLGGQVQQAPWGRRRRRRPPLSEFGHLKPLADGSFMLYPEHCGRFGGCTRCQLPDCDWNGWRKDGRG